MIPLEFLLLPKILSAFGRQCEDGWVRASKTEISRKFLYPRRRDPLTAQEFYARVMPGWISRDLAREVSRPRKTPYFLLRPMTLEEIETRIRQLEQEVQRIGELLRAKSPDFRQGDMNRLGDERMALLFERRARFDQRVTAACHRTLMLQELEKSKKRECAAA